MNLKFLIKQILISIRLIIYRKIFIPYKVYITRKKETINVVFSVGNLGAWKTERLYNMMLDHIRFNPILLIGSIENADDMDNLREYCLSKNYAFIEIPNAYNVNAKAFGADIVFLQKPYERFFLHHLNTLYCYAPYAFHGTILDSEYKTLYRYNCWQIYYENPILCKFYTSRIKDIHNGFATGIPIMDEFLDINKNRRHNPCQNKVAKKIIIYAPHHSIESNDGNWWNSSTFLETGELMLKIAEKYSDRIHWIFKPHPVLRRKLEQKWGVKKTDEYYKKWADSEWSQLETGAYMDIFAYSDAMIHDSGSFIIEYLYTGKPVMFLSKSDMVTINWNDTFKAAYNLHYRGFNAEDIEQFINTTVLNGNDVKFESRQMFVKSDLTPQMNHSSCENIINCILNKHTAKQFQIG